MTRNYLLTALFMVLGLGNLFGQVTHHINLYVNTAEITKPDEYRFCTFENQPADVDVREFTVQVNVGDIVIWHGISSSSPNDQVLISQINYQGGDNVFNSNVLNDTPENPGVVVGVVQPGTVGFTMKYVVNFKVLNNGIQRNGTYHLDPKIFVAPN
ncbi:inclusion body family protein [Fulvivirga sedimenti]|uniref:Inclusion body family protein n=1 Tax=Fulvivirga sedimenti TaxID=2879465 RepID=A0A9X1HNX1_9BACT|nr:inclusion body family protein [Fulvivirga sedimenti]MCA6075624.1 inclusion body family protein [Fulvivirga sedimenti]